MLANNSFKLGIGYLLVEVLDLIFVFSRRVW